MAERSQGLEVTGLFADWLQDRLSSEAWAWLSERLQAVSRGDWQVLALGFGMVPRKLGKADLDLTAEQLDKARLARPGWDPSRWSIDQAARTLLVLSWPSEDPRAYVGTLDRLFAAGEVGELVALYQALPLLPHSKAHRLRAAEGIRTNMKAVFSAVAHHNPYPAEQLDETAWNQMVLKAIFIQVPLDPIVGLDRRANPALMRMMADYAHERWSASRPISPELWRCVGPYADDEALADLGRALLEGSRDHQRAAALALASCPHPGAREWLKGFPELAREITVGTINWSTIAKLSS